MILWLRRSLAERPWCPAWLLSSHAITCSKRLTSEWTTSGTHTTRAVTDAPIPDGRRHQKMTSWASMRYAVVDVEGDGEQPPDLVQVAVVPVAAGIIGAPASWLVKPPRPVSRIAARIHGLTNEALAVAPAFADIESEVREALDADVLVAHNAGTSMSACYGAASAGGSALSRLHCSSGPKRPARPRKRSSGCTACTPQGGLPQSRDLLAELVT